MRNKLAFLPILILLLITLINAVPKIEPYVNDFTHTLSTEEVMQLNHLADRIEQNTSWEIAMVMVPDTEGLDRLDYASKLGDENGVGKKDKDNGLVVLWSEGADRGIAIATGRYSESIFNDAKVGRIARAARHYFDDGNYYLGFENITLELEKEIRGEVPEENTNELLTDTDIIIIIMVIALIVFAGIIIIPLFIDPYSRSSSSSSGWTTSSSSGSSGGFSGGSFGGGSFGGGGCKA